MDELIKIQTNENNEKCVSCRELHEKLQSNERFSKWFQRMCSYGFIENVDYTPYFFVHPLNQQETQDYAIKLDMAKEICMIQRTEIGKKFRQYFIECEKALREQTQFKLPTTYKEALQQLLTQVEENERLQLENTELKPKADYHDKVLDTESCYTTTQIAKELEMSARQLNIMLNHLGIQYKQSGQWLLTKKYQDKGYVKTRTHLINDSKTKHSTVWTEKGREFLLDVAEDF